MHSLLERGSRTGAQPWARLWDEGHGQVWGSHAEHTSRHLSALTAPMLQAP